ncbi:MAG: hypothetical protein IT176_13300 [Acidobacteria bacterium]|nr:hypothetical protein [Acidobacteriota bacterium]
MPPVEERVASLDGGLEPPAPAIGEFRSDVRELRAEMIRRFEPIDGRLNRVDNRIG